MRYEVSKAALKILKEGKTDSVQCLKTGKVLTLEDCEKAGLFKPKSYGAKKELDA